VWLIYPRHCTPISVNICWGYAQKCGIVLMQCISNSITVSYV